MNLKQILCLVVAAMFMVPAFAREKKAKPVRGNFVSKTEETIVIKIKDAEKTYTISEDTKILNAKGEEVESSELEGKVVILKTDPKNATNVTEVKIAPPPKAKGPRKKKKEKPVEPAEEE